MTRPGLGRGSTCDGPVLGRDPGDGRDRVPWPERMPRPGPRPGPEPAARTVPGKIGQTGKHRTGSEPGSPGLAEAARPSQGQCQVKAGPGQGQTEAGQAEAGEGPAKAQIEAGIRTAT